MHSLCGAILSIVALMQSAESTTRARTRFFVVPVFWMLFTGLSIWLSLFATHRLRLAAQRAALDGSDVEQLLAELDSDGSHYITTSQFKKFLQTLAPNLSPKDTNLCCRHFSRRPAHKAAGAEVEVERGTVSLKEVMAFLGGEYVGEHL
jgi:hypothetical protein